MRPRAARLILWSRHRIPKKADKRKEPPHKFPPQLLPSENLSTLPRITVQPSAVTDNTLRIYDTRQKNSPPATCVCEYVCVLKVHRGTRGRRIKNRKRLLLQVVRFVGGEALQILKDSPDADPPSLASISNQSLGYFCFCYKWYFHTHICTHTLTCALFFSPIGWMNGQKDKGKDRGLRNTTGTNVTFVFSWFCFFPVQWTMLLSGADGRENYAVWVWKTRNKCLYVVSYELEAFESLYEVTAKCFWWQKV